MKTFKLIHEASTVVVSKLDKVITMKRKLQTIFPDQHKCKNP